jgi:uncharacterized protein YdeI (YjbR/CyaY-like superfamily)
MGMTRAEGRRVNGEVRLEMEINLQTSAPARPLWPAGHLPHEGEISSFDAAQGGTTMAPIKVDLDKVREFPDAESFYAWLADNHAGESEVWIKVHKVGSGLPSITPKEAIDVALCFGWIDAVRKSLDDKSFLQRYTPRGKRSIWSKINIDNVARLIEEGRMTEHGLREVNAAKADGRWDRAYGGSKEMTIPADLQAAIDAEPKAKAMLEKLSAQNRFALAFRTHNMKTEAGRKKKIADLVAMLKRGETIHPQKKK